MSADDYGPNLAPHHTELLRASAISPEVAATRGYYTATKKAELEELGFGVKQRRVPALVIPIRNVRGEVVLHQIRSDNPRRDKNGKALKYETPSGAKMALDVPPAARSPLGDPSRPLIITEGARKADAAVSQGLCCISLLGVFNFRGSNEQGGTTVLPDWEYIALNERKTYICFDSDVMEKMEVHVALARLGAVLKSRKAQVAYVYLPGGEGGCKVGLDDYLADGHTVDDLLSLATSEARKPEGGFTLRAEPSKATLLIDSAENIKLFHAPDGTPYASFPVRSHHETWPVRSRGFKLWARHLYFTKFKGALDAQALQEAVGVWEARALFEGPTIEVAVRIADHDGSLYVDLADREWRAVKITADGWDVVSSHELPVPFRRAPGMSPLPFPKRDGDLRVLRSFLNLRSDDYWHLQLAWVVNVLFPDGPFPVLCLHGEQGSGKSNNARVIRRFVDPNESPLRSQPSSTRDLMISASNSWLLVFDNLSSIQPWLSDAYCMLATGGGFSTRQLYTDDEERIFASKRPTILTGIEEVATRADLLDRALLLGLEQIEPSRRRTEKQLEADLAAAAPAIQGALFDAVVAAMREQVHVGLDAAPRMADFAVRGVAVERALAWPSGSFLGAYESNRSEVNDLPVESSMIGPPLMAFVQDGGCQDQTWTELLAELRKRVPDPTARLKEWPKSARALSGEVRRLAPNLRRMGISVKWGRSGGRRWVSLETAQQDRHDGHDGHPIEEGAEETATYGKSPGAGGVPVGGDGAGGDGHRVPDSGRDGHPVSGRDSYESAGGDGGARDAGAFEEGAV
jgi:hypothetical protein